MAGEVAREVVRDAADVEVVEVAGETVVESGGIKGTGVTSSGGAADGAVV